MTDKLFKALVVEETDDKKYTRQILDKSTDDLPPGDVLVEVHYSSLNYKDALSASGNKGVTRSYPHTPGIDAAGVVVESADSAFKPKDEVIVTSYDLGMNTAGGFGQYIRVPGQWVVPLPEGLTLREAMCYGTAGFTAALSVYQLTVHGGISPEHGEVLVSGATGGVGGIAVAILSKLGYAVVAVNGSVDASEYLKEIGAQRIISIEEATDQSGRVYPFILRGISLVGIDSQNCPMPKRLKTWEKLAGEWKIPKMETVVEEIALVDLDQAIDRMLQRKHKGRSIVNMTA